MIKFLLPLSFLSVIPAQAMQIDPIEGRHLGRYPLYQEGDTGAVKGNATLFRTTAGKYFGITCAHCIPYLDSLSFLVTGKKKYDNIFACTSYSSIDNIKVHPSYKYKSKKEDSKYDIALFTVNGNSNLKFFDGEISTNKPQNHEQYFVDIKSYGPLFAKDGSSYEESIFHHLTCSLQFDEEGYFFHPFQARDFYISFLPTKNGEFILGGGLLSGPGKFNLVSGDSGSLVENEGKAIALASAAGKDLGKLLELLPKEFLEVEKIDENFKKTLLQTIEDRIANHAQTLKSSSGQDILLFTLKENLCSIEGNDYYTPLALHADFINDYINNIPESPQESKNELKIITVDRDTDVCHNPELLEAYLNYDMGLNFIEEMRATLDSHDKEFTDSLKSFDFDRVLSSEEILENAITALKDRSPEEIEYLLAYYKEVMSPMDFESLLKAISYNL